MTTTEQKAFIRAYEKVQKRKRLSWKASRSVVYYTAWCDVSFPSQTAQETFSIYLRKSAIYYMSMLNAL